MPTKPTADYVANIVAEDWVRAWSTLNRRDEALWQMYDWENSVGGPSHIDIERVRSGAIPDSANRLVGIMLRKPQFEIVPINLSRKEQERNTNAEQWLEGALAQAERDQGHSVQYPFYLDLALTGRGIWQVTAEPYLWSKEAGYPVRTLILNEDDEEMVDLDDDTYADMVRRFKYAAKFPITWKHLDSTDVWYHFGPQGRADEVITRKRVRLSDLRNRYGTKVAATFLSERATASEASRTFVHVYEYWNDGYYLAIAGDQVLLSGEPDPTPAVATNVELKRSEHQYGMPPFAIAEGLTTGRPEPHRRLIPPLYDIFHLAKTADRFLSMKGTDARQHALRTLIHKVSERNPPEPDEQGRPRVREIVDGETIHAWPDESFEPLLKGNPDSGTDQMLATLFSLLAQNGLAPVVRGSTTGIESGYQQNTAYLQAVAKMKPMSENISKAYEQVARLFLKSILVMDEDIPVYYADKETRRFIELGPDDIKGDERIIVHYNAEVPRDEIAMLQAFTMAVQNGLPAKWALQKFLNEGSADQIEDMQLIEAFNKSPARLQYLLAHALAKAGEVPQAENAQALMSMLQNIEQLPPGLQEQLRTMGMAPIPQSPQVTSPGAGGPAISNVTTTAQNPGATPGPGQGGRAAGQPQATPVTSLPETPRVP